MYVMNFDPKAILEAYNPRTQASRVKCLVLMSLCYVHTHKNRPTGDLTQT